MQFETKNFALTGADGALLCTAHLAIPAGDGASAGPDAFASAWCGCLSGECERFVREKLREQAQAAYAADPNPARRFSFPYYVYTLTFRVREEGDELCVSAAARLTRAGEVIGAGERTARFCAAGIGSLRVRARHGAKKSKK